MDPRSLTTASTYINNLLLSRGLLRNGTPIDFATQEKAAGGGEATMVKIMNLVHDLILRRDREVDTLGNLSQTLQTLRTSSAQQTQSIARLEAQNADLERQIALSNAQDQAAKKAVKQAEVRTKALKDEMTKLKGTVAQIRQQCASDVRRKDQELARLKRHLEGRRGNGGQIGVTVITPGISKPPPGSKNAGNHVDVASSQYNLRQETTEFLTQLSQGLSDENDALISLIRDTLSNLRHLQGLPPDPILHSQNSCDTSTSEFRNAIVSAPPSYQALASSTEEVMANLHSLLTNPSFVPLEEVQIRDDEILKLRGSWVKMEARWREAVALMDGWRKRMEHTGDTINLDDLQMGMDLGAGLPEAPSPSQKLHLPPVEHEAANGDITIMKDPHEDSGMTLPNGGEDDNILDGEYGNDSADQESPESNALRRRSGNARPSQIPRKVPFADIAEENTKAIRDFEDELILDLCNESGPTIPDENASPVSKRAGSPISSPRTVQQKLERARTEAEEARKREEKKGKRKSGVVKKLRSSRRRSTLSPEELEKLLGIV
ncbi:MAG: hypothetical protein L6R38_007216 [Xanthoria sp. 2 TBL-2021]|nr:MAG: hypothetical protein L6R38_007216 [Xanthoria sp. 2 TBL-2021]